MSGQVVIQGTFEAVDFKALKDLIEAEDSTIPGIPKYIKKYLGDGGCNGGVFKFEPQSLDDLGQKFKCFDFMITLPNDADTEKCCESVDSIDALLLPTNHPSHVSADLPTLSVPSQMSSRFFPVALCFLWNLGY